MATAPDDGIATPGQAAYMASSPPEPSPPTAPPVMQLPVIETNGHPRTSSTPINGHDVQDADKSPRVGKCFQSEEEAYQFYNAYAQTKGFSIRKCHLKYRADGTLSSRYYVCSKAGVKTANPTRAVKKEQAISRTNCMARVQFSITPDGIWRAQKVILYHNHQLASPDKRHMLRSQRQLLDADRHMIKKMSTSGIKQAEIYYFCELWYGKDAIPFLQMDCNNYLRSARSKYLETKDAQTLMEYLKNKQAEDPSFFYAMQLDDDDGTIMNIFWTDGRAIMDYSVFGDALSFDTTFSTNKFQMPFASFIGVNHHKQTILFGAALLSNESADTFEWVFRTFLQAMSGFSQKHDIVFVYGTYKVTSFEYKNDEAMVAFNPATLEISCSCKLYGCVGILCKHAHKVFTCCNIIILPSQYISNRWTKYAKQEIFTSKPNSNDSLESMFAHTSRKMISLALKCKTSKEVLTYLNNGIDKLALEALELLSNLNLGEDEDSENSSEMTEYVAKTTVPFRAPERIKGSKQKRSKDVLEGAKKGKKKGKGTNYPAKESVFVPSTAGPSESDCAGTTNPPITMAFSGHPSFLVPPIQGEFTRLLLDAHGDGTTLPAVRQLLSLSSAVKC